MGPASSTHACKDKVAVGFFTIAFAAGFGRAGNLTCWISGVRGPWLWTPEPLWQDRPGESTPCGLPPLAGRRSQNEGGAGQLPNSTYWGPFLSALVQLQLPSHQDSPTPTVPGALPSAYARPIPYNKVCFALKPGLCRPGCELKRSAEWLSGGSRPIENRQEAGS